MRQQPRPARRFYRETEEDPQNQLLQRSPREATANSYTPRIASHTQHRHQLNGHNHTERQGPSQTGSNNQNEASQRRRQERQEAQKEAKNKRWLDGFIDQEKKASQTPIETEENVTVYFPRKPYQQQIKYMRKLVKCYSKGQTVTNAFMESPTGTGKTLCNLTATLAWVYHQRKYFKRQHRVLYISRTHSQLEQVIKELKETCYRPSMTIMGSKNHLCINPDINLQQVKGMELRECCSGKVRDWYKLKRKGLKQQEKASLTLNACHQYGDKFHTISVGQGLQNKIFSNQEIKQLGKKDKFCPSYYSQYMQQYCDLFVMPYNYILDIGILERYSHLITNSILIFDQAHNVAENSCQGRSFHLWGAHLKGLKKEITHLDMNLQAVPNEQEDLKETREAMEDINQLNEANISHLQQNIFKFLNQIEFHLAANPQRTYKNLWYKVFEVDKVEDRKYTCIIRSRYVQLSLVRMIYNLSDNETRRYKDSPQVRLNFLNKTIEFLGKLIELNRETYEQFKKINGAKFYNMQQVMKMLGRMKNLLLQSRDASSNLYNNEILHYCLVINVTLGQLLENDHYAIKDYNFSLNCLVPWFTFGEIQASNPHSIVFCSGTMSPLEDWTHQLNIEGILFSNQHVIKPEQAKLNILTHDIKGNLFDFTASNLQPAQDQNGTLSVLQKRLTRKRHYLSMMETIAAITQNVPGGVLVIFPNYSMKDDIKNYLEQDLQKDFHKIFKKIETRKKQFFEAKGTTEPVDLYKKHIQDGNEAVLYCVCRGKASEGVDFPDALCRAVIFIGIPYPNIHQPLMNEKMLHYIHLAKKSKDIPQLQSISWSNYNFNQTIRALNQGLGRVIRHKYDYGQIFLLDSRYSPQFQKYVHYESKNKKKVQDHLPSWATKNSEKWGGSVAGIQQRLNRLMSFYEWNAANTRAPNI